MRSCIDLDQTASIHFRLARRLGEQQQDGGQRGEQDALKYFEQQHGAESNDANLTPRDSDKVSEV
jgi:hypothetical protein